MHAFHEFPGASHDPKYRTVNWFGEQFSFSPQQAKCIEVLWRFWMQGTPIIREDMVLEVAGSTARALKEVFASGPGKGAWGRMIDKGDHRGTVRLLVPAGETPDVIKAPTAGQPAPQFSSPFRQGA